MMIIRPIALSDLDGLLRMISSIGVGLTTLPNNRALLQGRIVASEASFAGKAARADEQYMFVLENTETGYIVGVAALAAAVGLQEPWYSYRVGQVVHASRELGIFNQTPTLFLSNDHTGATELCSLFLHPDYRRGRNGGMAAVTHTQRVARRLDPRSCRRDVVAGIFGDDRKRIASRRFRRHAARRRQSRFRRDQGGPHVARELQALEGGEHRH